MMAERTGEPRVILRVAILDDDPGVIPAVHIWTSHDVPWLEFTRTTKRLTEGRGSAAAP